MHKAVIKVARILLICSKKYHELNVYVNYTYVRNSIAVIQLRSYSMCYVHKYE